tara:strand:+ start:499 stop:732 length:234 start_codon:yes stop_codon:yes gene_type:complete
MSKRTRFLISVQDYLAVKGPTTVVELIDNVKSKYGKKYRSGPSPKELGNIMRIDKRFVVIRKANHSDISLWGLNEDE